ncbi:DUF3383 family protein [Campylobacter sp. 9BO]|uniref:DUF3383 family protein n=1 Tax=Campylobacter sp. 9BO TaxID=3424759 RepID=UPI003D3265E3
MSLTIKRVVNVALNELGQIAKNRDFSVIAVLTDESCEAFNDPSIRHIVISSAQDASNYFGGDSRVATAVKSIFAVSGVKSAIIAKWVKAQRKIQATPNELRGSALNVGINALKLADAKFSINLGGTTKQISVDLSGAIDLNDVATKLTMALNGENVKATYDADGNRFKLTATTAGTSGAKIGFLSAPDSGSDISAMLNLIDGKADIINGVDGSTQPKESITQALDKLYNATQAFYGVYSSAVISDEEIEALDLWVSTAQSPCVAGYTITRLVQLENQNSNIIKQIAKKDSGRFFATFNNTGDEFAGLELLAKAVSTNWEGSYTAQTMKFKNLKTQEATKLSR